MGKGKATLVFDGNYFLFKTLHVIPRSPGNSSGLLLSTEDEQRNFVRKLATDFAYEIRKFKDMCGKIVFTVDSKSWRKDLFPESNYKGHRVIDETIEWNAFHRLVEEFKQMLSKKGVIVHRVDGAEGDDLLFAWSMWLNSNSQDCIVFSGDRDLVQLVDMNQSTNSFTIYYSSYHKQFKVFTGFNEWISKRSEFDIFNMTNSTVNDKVKIALDSIISMNQLEVEEVNSDEFVFLKMLTGDKGDNVKSVYTQKKPDKNGKMKEYGVTELKAKKIYDRFVESFGPFKEEYFFDKSFRSEIAKLIVQEMKISDVSVDAIESKIELNCNLMLLHSSIIPQSIQDGIYSSIELTKDVHTDVYKMQSKEMILEGTEYSKTDYVPSAYDPFKNIKNVNFSFDPNKKDESQNSLF